jgi:hypothetical protein
VATEAQGTVYIYSTINRVEKLDYFLKQNREMGHISFFGVRGD